MFCYWVSEQMDSIVVNVEMDRQKELTHKRFCITRVSEMAHEIQIAIR